MTAMPKTVERLYGRRAYIGASLALLIAALLLPSGMAALGLPGGLGSLFALGFLILLTIITYGRLRDARLSGSWVVLMLFAFEVGPTWVGPPPLVLYLGDLVHLIPVILGWVAPARPAPEIEPEAVPSTIG